ncbi:hypothetical protein PCH_Pc13g07010 [Penicillium rubens Wisconsin 54-1255]|uniref:Uncharacterized protein n=1 Tax=Penicillium rubens (strain ATCC 28089 / DSM 1075 / NRRL 1951 / Wisconsin 54-1255) TaxID=500485 RepID=B6H3N9_PENRW|nr:hypothetical protein PCH_Pc13g07010 [Penicillium rubens Wisconsin 54-1255]
MAAGSCLIHAPVSEPAYMGSHPLVPLLSIDGRKTKIGDLNDVLLLPMIGFHSDLSLPLCVLEALGTVPQGVLSMCLVDTIYGNEVTIGTNYAVLREYTVFNRAIA